MSRKRRASQLTAAECLEAYATATGGEKMRLFGALLEHLRRKVPEVVTFSRQQKWNINVSP